MVKTSASMVRELREKTGAGMMDCKKALVASEGDLKKAITFLREKGLAAASKKSSRVAAQGLIGITSQDSVAAMVEVNCETDFVAKNEEFQGLVSDLCNHIAFTNDIKLGETTDANTLSDQIVKNSGESISSLVKSKIASIGENITFRRFIKYDDGSVYGSYVHGQGSIGSLVVLGLDDQSKASSPQIKELAKDLAMQVAASAPLFLHKSDVDSETLDNERSILRTQALKQGKPEAIADKVAQGRIGKYYEENCLMHQVFVKDSKLSIEKLVNNIAKENGCKINVLHFSRFKVGEGIEAKQDNFLEEVNKMAS